MDLKGCFSKLSDEWETPKDLFIELDKEFHFTLDPCCTSTNHLCDKYYTYLEDGLSHDWLNETVFCNPPYSKCNDWIMKCFYESKINNAICVCLVPSRTDTKWFHNFCLPYAEIRFIRGRLKFSNSCSGAPFPSMICIFRKEKAI